MEAGGVRSVLYNLAKSVLRFVRWLLFLLCAPSCQFQTSLCQFPRKSRSLMDNPLERNRLSTRKITTSLETHSPPSSDFYNNNPPNPFLKILG